jgi:hypothetical protein
MKLDTKIEGTRERLNEAIKTKGVMDKRTIKVSEQLDRLIVKRMALGYSRS